MLDDLLSNPWAYMPPRSSLWLWVGAPLLVLIIYFLTTRSTAVRKKRLREAEIWRASVGPERPAEDAAQPDAKKKSKDGKKAAPPPSAGPPRVSRMPAQLEAALRDVGGGTVIAHYELVKDVAYLSLMEANETAGSDYQAVTAKLETRGPFMVVRPLPVVDGQRVANNGVQFKKDPEFMSLFLVEGSDAKAIGKWLSPPLRRALCELPSAWLRVAGQTMTVSVFGTLEADQLDQLVEVADTLFAEHGAEGGPSLFGDDGAERPAAASSNPESPFVDDAGGEKKGKASDKKRPPPATATTMAETPSSKRRI